MIALSGTRMSWLTSAASWETTVAAAWPTSGAAGAGRSRSSRSSISLVTLSASVSRDRRCKGVSVFGSGSMTQSRPTISPLGA